MPTKISFTNPNFAQLGAHLEAAAARGLPMVAPDCHGGAPGAVICALGPSIEHRHVLRAVRGYAGRGYNLFGIKEAITHLRARGLKVAYGVNMDPGAQEVERTPVYRNVVYCLASSCHPRLYDHVLAGGAKPLVYHSACGYCRHRLEPGFVLDLNEHQKAIVQGVFELATDDGLAFSPVCVAQVPEMAVYKALFGRGDVMIGGYTVANRALALAQYMGFEDIVLAGADFGWRQKSQDNYYAAFVSARPVDETFAVDDGRVDGEPWVTRPDLLASAVDVARKIIAG